MGTDKFELFLSVPHLWAKNSVLHKNIAMRIGHHDIGVCSWSLRAPDTHAMIGAIPSLGLSHCQLALTPLVLADEPICRQQIGLIQHSGLGLPAGMISFPGRGLFLHSCHSPQRRICARCRVAVARANRRTGDGSRPFAGDQKNLHAYWLYPAQQ